ncbi:hypothetical protein ACEWY4_020984 [Coilia grayii]|uniref:arylamine N-acetyltransferase n=1 Tax=Coilia grayii TaxID=363190 RepID=A0ABD1JAX4_9TELE
MDLQEYFLRIGFSGPFERPDLPALQLVHRLHVMTIPFENLCAHSQEQVSTELTQIFSKLVHQRRGGCCYESNLLFAWVLGQMGYTYTVLGARIYNFQLKAFSQLEGHLIIRVEVAGRSYIADVSFGLADQIWEPLELVSGKEQPQPGGTFCLKEDGDTWVLERTTRTPLVRNKAFANSNLVVRSPVNIIFCFTLQPRQLKDFHAAVNFLTTSPKSLYTNKSMCSLVTPTGYRALVGWVYLEVTFAYQEKFDLMEMRRITEAEVQDVLRERFGLPTIPNLQLRDNRVSAIL